MVRVEEDFENKIERIRDRLDNLDKAREELIKLTRELKKNSTLVISRINSGEMEEAEKILRKALHIFETVKSFERDYPEIYYPLTRDSMQELVEALVFYEIVKKKKLSIPELDVQPSSILTGLADAAGELRRYTLDLLRKSMFEEAEEMMEFIEKIYSSLVTFSYPDRIVPGLKGKIDMVRFALERTKSDFISARR